MGRSFASSASSSSRFRSLADLRPFVSSGGSGMAAMTASVVSTTGFMAATSCTRTMYAPFRMHAVTAAAVAKSVSMGSARARKDLRDGPIRMGNSKRRNSPRRAMTSEFCSFRLPKPRPGSMTMWSRSIPARLARCTAASSSPAISPITSRIGGIFAHWSGIPRMWFRMSPASVFRTVFTSSGSHVSPETSLMMWAPCSSAFSATAGLYVSTESGISR